MEEKYRKAVVIDGSPEPDGGEPCKHGDRRGDRDDDRGARKERQPEARQSCGEHVVHPDAETQDHGRDRRQGQQRIADERPPAEHRQAVRDHAHGRQHDGVDPGMAEDPEKVLPQQRLAAAGGIEKVGAELAIHPQQQKRKAYRRYYDQVRHARRQRPPDQDRHAVDRHPRCPGPHRRHDEVSGADGCRDPEQHHAERIEVLIEPRVVVPRCVGHVVEPTIVRAVAGQKSRVQKNAAAR